jgi:hypothetical protein
MSESSNGHNGSVEIMTGADLRDLITGYAGAFATFETVNYPGDDNETSRSVRGTVVHGIVEPGPYPVGYDPVAGIRLKEPTITRNGQTRPTPIKRWTLTDSAEVTVQHSGDTVLRWSNGSNGKTLASFMLRLSYRE